MKFTTCVLLLSAGIYSAAQADEPPPAAPSPTAQAATAPVPAPSAPAVGDAGTATTATPVAAGAAETPAKVDKSQLVDVAATDALIKKMRGRGYKPVNRKGILVFCRPEGEIGTHFQRERCNTLDELKDAERTGKEFTNQIQQQGSPTEFKPDMAPNPHR
jgi:hypothetical protein